VDLYSANPSRRWSWRAFLTVLCIGLVVFSATVQVAHSHADHETSHADCSLCVVSHAAALTAAPPIVLVLVTFVSRVEIATPITRPQPLLSFALFTRPPPADLTLA
jgi:hypothetical protein